MRSLKFFSLMMLMCLLVFCVSGCGGSLGSEDGGSTSVVSDDVPVVSDDVPVISEDIIYDPAILGGAWRVVDQEVRIDDADIEDGLELLLVRSEMMISGVMVSGSSGSAVVSLHQDWRLTWPDSEISFASVNIEAKSVRLGRTEGNKWRCEFTEAGASDNENTILRGTVINLEIVSETEIKAIHYGIIPVTRRTGLTITNNLITYNALEINYRHSDQDNTPSFPSDSEDIPVPIEPSELLKGTWKVTDGEIKIENAGIEDGTELLLIVSDITLDDVKITGDSGTARMTLRQNWRLVWFDGSISFAPVNINAKAVRLEKTDANTWRCEFTEAGTSENENTILRGTVINLEVVTESEVKAVHYGIIPVYHEKDFINATDFITYNALEMNYRHSSEPGRYIPEESKDISSDPVYSLAGTWKVMDQEVKREINFEEGGELLLIYSDITISDLRVSGDTAAAVMTLSQSWRLTWEETITDSEGNEITNSYINFLPVNVSAKAVRMSRQGNNKWRLVFDESGLERDESNIMNGTVINFEIISPQSIKTIHYGIVPAYNEKRSYNLIHFDGAEINYRKE